MQHGVHPPTMRCRTAAPTASPVQRSRRTDLASMTVLAPVPDKDTSSQRRTRTWSADRGGHRRPAITAADRTYPLVPEACGAFHHLRMSLAADR